MTRHNGCRENCSGVNCFNSAQWCHDGVACRHSGVGKSESEHEARTANLLVLLSPVTKKRGVDRLRCAFLNLEYVKEAHLYIVSMIRDPVQIYLFFRVIEICKLFLHRLKKYIQNWCGNWIEFYELGLNYLCLIRGLAGEWTLNLTCNVLKRLLCLNFEMSCLVFCASNSKSCRSVVI